jgi:hypothetical protein
MTCGVCAHVLVCVAMCTVLPRMFRDKVSRTPPRKSGSPRNAANCLGSCRELSWQACRGVWVGTWLRMRGLRVFRRETVAGLQRAPNRVASISIRDTRNMFAKVSRTLSSRNILGNTVLRSLRAGTSRTVRLVSGGASAALQGPAVPGWAAAAPPHWSWSSGRQGCTAIGSRPR